MDEIDNDPTPPRSKPGRTIALVAAGVAVGVVLGAAGIAGAATNQPSPSSTSPGLAAPPLHPPVQRHHGARGLARALHGQLVVPNGSSGFKTIQVQRGHLTAVSPTSLTVTSRDGFVGTYVLTANTVVDGGRAALSSLKIGATVGVLADLVDGTATATHVRDLSALRELRRTGPGVRARASGRTGSGAGRPA